MLVKTPPSKGGCLLTKFVRTLYGFLISVCLNIKDWLCLYWCACNYRWSSNCKSRKLLCMQNPFFKLAKLNHLYKIYKTNTHRSLKLWRTEKQNHSLFLSKVRWSFHDHRSKNVTRATPKDPHKNINHGGIERGNKPGKMYRCQRYIISRCAKYHYCLIIGVIT